MLFFTELKVNLIRYWIPGAYRFLCLYISCYEFFLIITREYLTDCDLSVFAGIGLDDVFILLSGLGDAPLRRADGSPTNTQERISFAMATSGVSITITSLTDFLAFGIGSSSSFVAIRNFSIYTGSLVDFSLSSQTSFISDRVFFSSCFF